MGEWTIFSNHGHVLVCLANNNQARLRDVAAAVGITERAVQNILRELQDTGLVLVSKHGRCNHYQINTRKSLRHPLEAHCTVGQLLQLLKSEAVESAAPETAATVSSAAVAAEPGKAAAARAGVSRAPAAKVDHAKAETAKAETAKAETTKAETGKAEPASKSADKVDGPDEKPEDEKPDTQQGSLF